MLATTYGDQQAYRWIVPVLFILGAGGVIHSGGVLAQESAPQEGASDGEYGEPLHWEIDREAKLPELERYPQGGPNEVRDILVVGDTVYAATADGIWHFRLWDSRHCWRALTYNVSDGLPSNNCHRLRRDAKGGIWTLCQGGVAYLAADAIEWLAFTRHNGLPSGVLTDMALSPDGRRVWVTSTEGLATASIDDQQWRVFPERNLMDVFVHPSKEIVWCRTKLLLKDCGLGDPYVRRLLQFDLASGRWHIIPKSAWTKWGAEPVHFSQERHLLCLATAEPPLLYDLPNNETVQICPDRPEWSQVEDGWIQWYDDEFGGLLTWRIGDGEYWFATSTGLWEYRPEDGNWTGHLYRQKPGWNVALSCTSRDGNRAFWCDGDELAVFDLSSARWTKLADQDIEVDLDEHSRLTLSPDESSLWLTGSQEIVVYCLDSNRLVELSDSDHPGLSTPTLVRFEEASKVTVIGTSRGVVCADYQGHLRSALSRPIPPMPRQPRRFVFAPDGSEVWCFPGAQVLFPEDDCWASMGTPEDKVSVGDVVFAPDGKTVWHTTCLERNEGDIVLHRRPGDRWKGHPLKATLPFYPLGIQRLLLSPCGSELWIGTHTRGLFRVNLASGDVSQYPYDMTAVTDKITLREVMFTGDQKSVVCVNDDEKEWSILRIDLASGEESRIPVGDVRIEKVFPSPDGLALWCTSGVVGELWKVDLQEKVVSQCPQPVKEERAFEREATACVLSPNGRHLCMRSWDDVAVYSTNENRWRRFRGEEWRRDGYCCYETAGLTITPDSKTVLCDHQRGLALIDVDEEDYEVLSPPGADGGCTISHMCPVPGSEDWVCAIYHIDVGGLYRADLKQKTLHMLRELPGAEVSAMAIAPDGYLWAAIKERVLCLDPATGAKREGLAALRIGALETVRLDGTSN